MAAPAFGTLGTTSGGSSGTTCDVPVPLSVASGDVLLIPLYVETTQAVTPPAGFQEAHDSPAVVTGAQAHNLHMYWKRATAADTGNYSFTIATGLAWRMGIALRFTGVVTSGYPFDVTNSAVKTTTTDGTTSAVRRSTNGPDRLWVWAASFWNGDITCTPPAGFTERADIQGGVGLDVATLAQTVQGDSGALSGTFAGNGATGAWLGALLPAPASNGRMMAAF